MRTIAVARTTAQWSRIRSDLMLLQADPRVEPETLQLLLDLEAMLVLDGDRVSERPLPVGMIGDVQHAKPLEERLAAERFPSKVDVESTHYENCYQQHPACAYGLGVFDTITAATTAPATPRKAT